MESKKKKKKKNWSEESRDKTGIKIGNINSFLQFWGKAN